MGIVYSNSHDGESPIIFRAGPGQPCPVCITTSKGCSATERGLHFCRGDAQPGWKLIGDSSDAAGFFHFRREDDSPKHKRAKAKKPAKPTTEKPKPAKDWSATAKTGCDDLARRPHLLARLAEKLGVPAEALQAVGVGLGTMTSDSTEFRFPERDAEGTVIGIATRTEHRTRKAKKSFLKGGHRGLILPDKWDETPGPLLLVEGPTDTAALVAAGLCAIGRPSNTGGIPLLAELLTGWPVDRGILVVGENDTKGNGDWPGRDGADGTATTLAAKRDRLVRWTLPPENAKDVRDWLTTTERGETPWPERGHELLKHLEANAVDVLPPANVNRICEVVIGQDEFRVNDEVTNALGQDADIYQRGGMLVRILEHREEENPKSRVRRHEGEPIIRDVSPANLRETLTRHVAFQRLTEEGIVPAHPPAWCVRAVHERGTWRGVRHLEAVINHPVLLPDGSILASNGFDANSGLLVCIPPELTIEVPDRPTRNDVVNAVAMLSDVVSDFPFETPAHRSAWFAALLTPLAWFAFDGPAPLFLIDANTRGAGKGLLADTAALILTGRRFSVMSYTNDREELRKRITTLAVEGDRLVLLDNLAGAVGNDILDAALTSDRWKDRLLGGNRRYDGPLYVTWFGTGNNVQLHADTSRRVCHIRMESEEERPELKRGFRHTNLRKHVRHYRGELLSAALTILRGWMVAGKPLHNLPPWGSFEPWSDVVREAVVFAGLRDPGETREQLQTVADRDAAAMGTIIAAFRELDPDGRGITTADIVRRIKDSPNPPAWLDDLRGAVEELCGKLDARAIGLKFRGFKRRNFGGWFLDSIGAKNASRWMVRPISHGLQQTAAKRDSRDWQPSRGGDAGDAGDVSGDAKSADTFDAPPGYLFPFADQMLPD